MNAYLAEVVREREAAAEKRQARNFALSLLEVGKFTLEEIAELVNLPVSEVLTLAKKS